MLFGGVPQPEDPPGGIVPAATTVAADMPSMDSLPPEVEAILKDKVLQWRCKVFLGLGMTLEQSRHLTLDKAVDTNFVRGLVARGCDPSVAFDIVS